MSNPTRQQPAIRMITFNGVPPSGSSRRNQIAHLKNNSMLPSRSLGRLVARRVVASRIFFIRL
jgi:hypothetical protein